MPNLQGSHLIRGDPQRLDLDRPVDQIVCGENYGKLPGNCQALVSVQPVDPRHWQNHPSLIGPWTAPRDRIHIRCAHFTAQ